MCTKIVSIIFNLFEGAVGLLALAIAYAFIFEKDNDDHDVKLGTIVLILALIMILIPNMIFYIKGKFKAKDLLIYQFLPLIAGGGGYLIFQVYLF